MVDLSCDAKGQVAARLVDLVLDRSGPTQAAGSTPTQPRSGHRSSTLRSTSSGAKPTPYMTASMRPAGPRPSQLQMEFTYSWKSSGPPGQKAWRGTAHELPSSDIRQSACRSVASNGTLAQLPQFRLGQQLPYAALQMELQAGFLLLSVTLRPSAHERQNH